MSDQIQLEVGAAPWKGSSDATPGVVFDFYDMPLVGQLTQHGVQFVFQCLAGTVDKSNLWLYAPIGDAELDKLKELDGPAFDDRLDEIMLSRPVTVAIADGDVVRLFTPIDAQYKTSLGLIKAIRDWVERTIQLGSWAAAAL